MYVDVDASVVVSTCSWYRLAPPTPCLFSHTVIQVHSSRRDLLMCPYSICLDDCLLINPVNIWTMVSGAELF